MPLRVLKFGGTSMETPNHILSVARRILDYRTQGDTVLVVVSAMGQTTDELIRLAERVSRAPKRRELDMLVSAGERISMALLALALESLGCPAISFTGSQSGIVTDSRHSDARIRTIRPERLERELSRGRVVIVAGFQGVSPEKEVTTLGRGGSDTTAVALAVRFGADQCEIFTDVPGVLSADPRVVPGARLHSEIGYDPMIALSHLGGRVLFRRAVLLARKYALPVEVKSSFRQDAGSEEVRSKRTGQEGAGTRIVAGTGGSSRTGFRAEEIMETNQILGVTLESPVHWVRIWLPTGALVPPVSGEGKADDPTFLCFSRTSLPDDITLVQWVATPESSSQSWTEPSLWAAGSRVQVERGAALVSLVGEGILADGDLIRRAETILHAAEIPIWASQSGSLSLCLLVPAEAGEEACRHLHRDLIESAQR